MRHQYALINHVDLLTFIGTGKHVRVNRIHMIRTTLMSTPIPVLRIRRTTTGKRMVVVGAMGKLTLAVSSVLLLAIIAVTFSILDPLAFVTGSLP
jgi:hypothetical protein